MSVGLSYFPSWPSSWEELSDLAKSAALAAGVLYFLGKSFLGYGVSNMSVTPSVSRVPVDKSGNDWLELTLKIAKGDRETCLLESVTITMVDPANPGTPIAPTMQRNFKFTDIDGEPRLPRIPPGEATQFAFLMHVPTTEAVELQILIIAKAGFVGMWRGYWSSSITSLPASRQSQLH